MEERLDNTNKHTSNEAQLSRHERCTLARTTIVALLTLGFTCVEKKYDTLDLEEYHCLILALIL